MIIWPIVFHILTNARVALIVLIALNDWAIFFRHACGFCHWMNDILRVPQTFAATARLHHRYPVWPMSLPWPIPLLVTFNHEFPSVQKIVKTMAESSFSICAHLCSVLLNVREAYVAGCPFCINTEPSPFFDASVSTSTGSIGLYTDSTESDVIISIRFFISPS